nr:MAG TPA: hypothetical protein [Caudoviricetes sp.]DAZ70660.1 MAG TPA: hypothetical protein [Caudoviricetes sp.]
MPCEQKKPRPGLHTRPRGGASPQRTTAPF